ncbi:hypothetical protein ANN_04529 [Periplaneta americana]|uniref:Uncharacterized protein n=1 Tax=Periplaneta americana TaxID=6978 RepID=A0ABQ8T8T0_PERAM|nr:hypothetical protein ANN_04529 [Periplaneta americana]
MAGLCESGNEPPGSLKASNSFPMRESFKYQLHPTKFQVNIKNNENSGTAAVVGSSEHSDVPTVISESEHTCATRYCEPATAGQVMVFQKGKEELECEVMVVDSNPAWTI